MEILEKSDSVSADVQKTRIVLVVNGVETFVALDLKQTPPALKMEIEAKWEIPCDRQEISLDGQEQLDDFQKLTDQLVV